MAAQDLTRCALAIDIGGTKFAAGIVTELGEIVSARRTANPQGRDPEKLYAALVEVVDSVLNAAGLDPEEPLALSGIGIATAAPLDREAGTVSPVNIPAWRGFPLRDRLVGRYGLEVRMFGDAVAVAVGEHWRGAARGRPNVLGMVVSTGIGGGVIIDGRVVPGTTGNAGHIGHISVDPFGPTCVCGGIGCLEAVASGTNIAAWAQAHGSAAPDATALADDARRGDPIALATFRRAGEAIGLAVAGAVTLLDLDVVVIGGGVAAAGPLLFDPIADGYTRYAGLGYAASPRVVPALLGGDAGLIGAAAVVLQADAYWPHPCPVLISMSVEHAQVTWFLRRSRSCCVNYFVTSRGRRAQRPARRRGRPARRRDVNHRHRRGQRRPSNLTMTGTFGHHRCSHTPQLAPRPRQSASPAQTSR